MKYQVHIASAVIAAAGFLAPGMALAEGADGFQPAKPATQTATFIESDDKMLGKRGRGRGRGRGGDDDRGRDRDDDDHRGRDRDRDDDRSSGRSRPRIPGGSGCDDPGDVAEHAECRVGGETGTGATDGGGTTIGRGHGGRPRIPGGSGCDDPGDLLEHPECQG